MSVLPDVPRRYTALAEIQARAMSNEPLLDYQI